MLTYIVHGNSSWANTAPTYAEKSLLSYLVLGSTTVEEEAACASSGLQTTLCFVLAYLACFLTLNHHQCPKLQHIELSVVFWVVFFFSGLNWNGKMGQKNLAKAATVVDWVLSLTSEIIWGQLASHVVQRATRSYGVENVFGSRLFNQAKYILLSLFFSLAFVILQEKVGDRTGLNVPVTSSILTPCTYKN